MLVRALVTEPFQSTVNQRNALRRAFQADAYIILSHFFEWPAFELLAREVQRLRQHEVRRDLLMIETGGTPRKMATLGGHIIRQQSALVPLLYGGEWLLSFLSSIAGEPVVPFGDPVENYVVNTLWESGDVHGAHVDVFPYAFNVSIEAPALGCGGEIEFAPGTANPADLGKAGTQRIRLEPNEVMFFRSDSTAHAVSTLHAPTRRVVLSFAYANEATRHLRSYSSATLYS